MEQRGQDQLQQQQQPKQGQQEQQRREEPRPVGQGQGQQQEQRADFVCAICELDCLSQARWDQHIAGRKHRAKLRQAAGGRQAAPEPEPEPEPAQQGLPAAVGAETRLVKLLLEYDGTAYRGWQRQPAYATVQGTLEGAVGRLTREGCDALALRVAGRTDAGVHALAQVATLRTGWAGTMLELARGLNTRLPADIVVTHEEEAPPGFAPYDCRRKRYRYMLSAVPPTEGEAAVRDTHRIPSPPSP